MGPLTMLMFAIATLPLINQLMESSPGSQARFADDANDQRKAMFTKAMVE